MNETTQWPPSAEALADTTRCPSCFTELDGIACPSCGLRLDVPAAERLLEHVRHQLADDVKRHALIAEIRVENARVAEARRVDAERARVAREAFAREAFQAQQDPAAPPSPPPAFPRHPAPATEPVRRRSTVQILLLATGIVLVSVTAIFFALIAFLVTSASVRALLLFVIAGGVLATARGLRRRLPGTAEGIATLAVVLVAVDFVLVRAQRLFGSGALDGWLFTGIAAGLLAGLALVLAPRLRLRALRLSGLGLAPLSTFALGYGALATAGSGWATSVFVGSALTALGALALGRFARTPSEITWARSLAAGSLVVATLAGLGAFPTAVAGGTLTLVATAALWAWLAVVDGTAGVWKAGSGAGPVGRVAAASLGVTLTLGLVSLVARLAEVRPSAAASGVGNLGAGGLEPWLAAGSAVVAVGLALVARWRTGAALRPLAAVLRIAAASALVGAALLALPDLVVGIVALLNRVSAWLTVPLFARNALSDPWPLPEVPDIGSGFVIGVPSALAVTAIVGVLAVRLLDGETAAVWRSPGSRSAVGRATRVVAVDLVAIAALVAAILPAVPLVQTVALAAIVALAIALVGRRRLLSGGLRRVSAGTAGAGILLLLASARTTHDLWPVAIVAVLVAALTLRASLRLLPLPRLARLAARALLSVGSLVVALASVGRAPSWVSIESPARDGVVLLTLAGLVALVLLAVAPAVRPRVERALPRVEAGLLAATGLGGVVLGLTSGALSSIGVDDSLDPIGWATLFALVGAVGLLWILLPIAHRAPERIIAAALTPVALLTAATGFAGAAGVWGDVVAAGVVILLAAFGATILASTKPRRRAWDIATAVSVLAVLLVALPTDHAWLTLLLLAVAALLSASGEGSVLAGSAPRRHLAWLALPLATASLWLTLTRHSVTVVEAYTLPLAAVLLLLGLAVTRWRSAGNPGRAAAARGVDGRTALFAAALGTGIVPSVVVSGDGSLVGPLLLIAAGCLAAALVAALPEQVRGLALRLPLLGASLVAVGATASVRGVAAAGYGVAPAGYGGEPSRWAGDAWAVGGAGILLAAALVWRRPGAAPRWQSTVAGVTAIVVFTLPEVALVSADPTVVVRPIAATVALAAGSVFAAARLPGRASGILRALALGATTLVVLDALVFGVAYHVAFEALSAPLAAALVAGGAVDLRRDAGRRSWPALGVGLLVGLVPSLLADYVDVTALRVVLLGAAAIAVLLIGVRLHLQAPVVIGGTVVILHAFAQAWPGLQVLSTSVPWWLWAGVGGVLLIVVAATYERRIQQARAVTRTLASLR